MPILSANGRVVLASGLLLGFGVPGAARAEDSSRQELTLIARALDTFDRAAALPAARSAESLSLYRESADAFERLVARGVQNGKLYYNLGNAYYRLGDLGRAILAYRRARLYAPRDGPLEANLRSARALRANRIEEPARNRLLGNLLFWHVNTTARGRLYFAVTVFSAIWLVLTVNLFFGRRFATAIFLGGLLLSGISGISVAAQLRAGARHPDGVILAEDVVARTGNGESYQPMFEEDLQPGVEFTLIERRGDWLRIRLPDDQEGWIPADSAETL